MSDPIKAKRRYALRARRTLDKRYRIAASRSACRRLARLADFRRARHVGLYHPLASEADPRGLQTLAAPNQHFYWPRVAGDRLVFVRDTTTTRFAKSALGTHEPIGDRARPTAALDLIVVPLVAFDRNAGRIGLGGGYYDRTLAKAGTAPGFRRPSLIGLAFDAQRVGPIARRPWDVAMHAVVTERGIYRYRPNGG